MEVMNFLIYIPAGLVFILGIGSLLAFANSRNIGLLLIGIVFLGCAALAIAYLHWWPLLVALALTWVIKAVFGDPGAK